ncbi:MAG: methyltransferase regulatory domain-containing protein [Herminiimonas sp.]|nr:methyltransferase regulatory domain-containing protein [Herminiimonas sp.]
MTTWTSGYVAEIDYAHGYFRELSPALLSLATLNRSVATGTATPGRRMRYLELGFGQGVSLAIHAAACEGEFWGTDFHPGQAAHALEMVRAAGSDARVFDQSFTEFAARDDLPEFDFITVHGIWTWVSDENRAAIVDLVRRKLACGGVLYLSYNSLPGCAPLQPLRHLLHLHSELIGFADNGITAKVRDAMNFTQEVIDSEAHYFALNPMLAMRFAAMKEQPPGQMAHEYFCRDWEIMAFSQVEAMLREAKLEFACSASLLDHVDGIDLTPQWQALLADIAQPVLRESVRDYMLNTQFRKDIFVKGGRPMTALQRTEAYLASTFVLTTLPQDVPATLKGLAGELVFDQALYGPLLAALADRGHAPKTLASIVAAPGLAAWTVESVIQALLALNGEGHVHPAQAPAQADLAEARCRSLNTAILKRARYDNQVGFLASCVTGAGFQTRRIEQLFLLAHQNFLPVEEWPRFVFDTLIASGAKVVRRGETMEGEADSIAELLRQAADFCKRRLPIFQALRIV